MLSSPSFTQAFDRLNPEQQQAVTSFNSPVLVIAGPGTGKTQVLTMRIAYILLHEDIRPQNILALTFTESGVHAMRERLVSLIGPTAYYVHIQTFHSFCNDLILEYPDKFGLSSRDFTSLSDLEKFKLIRDLIHRLGLKRLRSFNETYFYVSSILSRIQDLKKEGVTPAAYAKLIDEWAQEIEKDPTLKNRRTGEDTEKLRRARKEVEKNRELLKLYEAYQEYLKERGRYDYEDMIVLVLEQLGSDPEFLSDLQERYFHFLIDEFQDTNGAQNKIVHLLASHFENPNLFAVGDDDQSIYRFQGANLSNMLLMRQTFANVTSIVLKVNYRSTQTIIDAASSVIVNNQERITNPRYGFEVDKSFVASAPLFKRSWRATLSLPKGSETEESGHEDVGQEPKVEHYTFSNAAIENYFLVEQIKKLLGTPEEKSREKIKESAETPIYQPLYTNPSPSDIAVIYRNNHDALEIMNVLDKAGIPYTLQGGFNILTDPFIQQCIDVIETVRAPQEAENNERLFNVLHHPWFHLKPVDIYRVYKLLKNHKASDKTLIDLILDEKKLKSAGVQDFAKLQDIVQKILTLHARLLTLTVVDQVEAILRETGVVAYLTERQEFRKIHRLNSLYTFVKKQNFGNHRLTLTELLEDLAVMREEGIAIPEERIEAVSEGVQLMTAHKAKGLEFAHVFIINCIDGKWGNKSVREVIKLPPSIIPARQDFDEAREEDERRLFYVALTRAKERATITHAQEYPLRDKHGAIVSQFVTEMDMRYQAEGDSASYEAQAMKAYELAIHDRETDPSEEEEKFLRTLVQSYRINAVAINTYLKCPRLFLYRHLVRVPEKKGKSAIYGTAIHEALERFFVEFKRKKRLPLKSFLLDAFSTRLEAVLTSKEEFDEALEKGLSTLGFYYDRYEKEFSIPFDTERDYNARPLYLDDIPLSGRIDKLEVCSSSQEELAGEVLRARLRSADHLQEKTPPQDTSDKNPPNTKYQIRNTRSLRVIDYKTGRARSANDILGMTASSRGERDYYNQLLFYKMLLSLDRQLTDFTVEDGMLDFVSCDAEGKGFAQVVLPLTDLELEELKGIVRDVYANIQALSFPKTDDRRRCEDCPYRGICWKDTLF